MKERVTGGFVHGAAVGVVCDLDDPEDMGRIRVWFPGMHDEAVSFWARIRASQAGDSRGNFIRPEMGDEVLVMFERGSMNQPFVVGCLWNGEDAIPGPGNADGANDHKWLQTRSGHQLVFNDNEGGGFIEIHDGTQRLHTRIDVPAEWITTRADTGFIHLRAPKGTIRLECQDLNVSTTERCVVQVKNTHRESVSGTRTVTIVEQDVDTRAVERFSLSTPQMTTTATRLVSTTGQTAVRIGEATATVKPKLDMVLEGEVRRTMVDAQYTVGQFRTSHDAQPSGPLKWTGETLRIEARGSVRLASAKNLSLIGGQVKGKGGSVTYGADEKDGQGIGDASSIAFEGGLVALNGGAGPAFPVSKMGDTLMGNCNHTTGPAPPIPAGPIPLFPYMVANPISKDVVSSVKVNGMAAAPAGATAIGAHIPPIPPPPWLPKPVNYRSSLVGAFDATFKGPLTAAVQAATSATDTVQSGESSKSVVTVEGEDAPTAERWHLRLSPLFGSVGAFTGKLSGVPPFPVAVGQVNIACQGVQATDRPLGVTTLMHAHSCSDIVPPPNAMIMGGGNVVAGISASAMGEAARWAADYAGAAYAGGAPLGHRAQRQVEPVEPGSDIVLQNETNALAPFPGWLEATAVGHPVDVGSGALFDRVVDCDWPGPVAWPWVRGYNALAAGPAHGGRLGIGWRLAVEESLTRHFVAEDGDGTDDSGDGTDDSSEAPGERFFWVLHTVDLRAVRLPAIAPGERATLPAERLLYARPDRQSFTLTDPAGITRRFVSHDGARARLVAVEDGDGVRVAVAWSDDGWPTLTDRAGHRVRLAAEGDEVAVLALGPGGRGPVERRVVYGFDPRGRLASVRGPSGTRRYRYDGFDRLVEEQIGDYRWVFHYDREGRVKATSGEDSRFAYAFEYLPAAQITRVTDGLGRTTAWRWDASHRVVGFTAPDGTATLIERDEAGRIVRRTEPLDRITTWAWDARGRVTERVDPDGAVWRWRYDAHGLVEAVDPCGATVRVARDAEGRVRRVRLADGQERLVQHDAHGRPLAEEQGGRTRAARYDADGWLVAVDDVRWAVDARGRPTAVEHPTRGAATLSRDAAGRLIGRQVGERAVRWPRGADGAVEGFVDADGGRWQRFRDAVGRPLGWQGPTGSERRSERGVDDRVRWHRGGAGHAYRRDALGRLAAVACDDGAWRGLVYDMAGRLRAIDGPDGRLVEVEPDPVGRPAAVRLASGGGWQIRRDARGRPIGALALGAGGRFETGLRRDAVGRLVDEAGPLGAAQARFDGRGLRRLRVGGVAVEIERDVDGRPTEVVAPDGVHAVAWRGDACAWRRPDGAVLERSADGWTLRGPDGAVRARYVAARDAAGRVVDDRLTVGGALRWWRRFERDAEGRLAGGYDAAGARCEAGWRTGPGQRLEADDEGPVEHDPPGRVLGFGAASSRHRLAWDAVDRLVRLDLPSGVGLQWLYDAFARPVERLERRPGRPVRRTRLQWWGDRLVGVEVDPAETGEAAGAVRAVHFALDPAAPQPWATWVDGRLWVWLLDAAHAVIGAVADGGAAWWAPAVDGRGAPLPGASREGAPPIPGPIPSLAGMWRDPVAGLHLNRFRWYRARWGRYLSPDPLGIAGGGLRYGHAGHDPTRRVDLLGLSCADPEAPAAPAGAVAAPTPPSAGLPETLSVRAPTMGADGPTELPLVPGTAPADLPFPLPPGEVADRLGAPTPDPAPLVGAAARAVGDALGLPPALAEIAERVAGLVTRD